MSDMAWEYRMTLSEQKDERGVVSVDEQLRVLQKFGFTLSEQTVLAMRELWEEWEKEGSWGREYSLPLYLDGCGDYNYENYT